MRNARQKHTSTIQICKGNYIYIYIYFKSYQFLGVFFNQKSVIESFVYKARFDNNDMKSSKYNRKDSNVIISIYNFKVHTKYLVC